jgi:hypothetical protein
MLRMVMGLPSTGRLKMRCKTPTILSATEIPVNRTKEKENGSGKQEEFIWYAE